MATFLRTSLLALLTVTTLAACSSTSERRSPSGTDSAETPASAAKKIVATLQDAEVRALVLGLYGAQEMLAAGDRRGAGLQAGRLIGDLDEQVAPLSDGRLLVLRELAVVADEAGYTPASQRAVARIEFQARNPGKDYLSFDRMQPASLTSRTLPARLLPTDPEVEKVLKDIAVLSETTADPVAPGAVAKPAETAGRPILAGSAVDSDGKLATEPSSAESLRMLLAAARTAYKRGDYDEAAKQLDALLDLARSSPDVPGDVVRDAQVLLADIELRRGHLARAESLLRDVLATWTKSGSPKEAAAGIGFLRLRWLLAAQGRFAAADGVSQGVDTARLGLAPGAQGAFDLEPPADASSAPFPEEVGAGGGASARDPRLEEIESAWRLGDGQRALQLAEAWLRDLQEAGADPALIRTARWIAARLALDNGAFARARELAAALLEEDAAEPIAGDERSRVLAFQERIDRRVEESRRAEEALLAGGAADWWEPGNDLPPDSWSSEDEAALRGALRSGRSEADGESKREPFDARAALEEAKRLQRTCSLEQALKLRRRIANAYEEFATFDDPERLEALRDLAALYRVLGETAAAREVERRIVD